MPITEANINYILQQEYPNKRFTIDMAAKIITQLNKDTGAQEATYTFEQARQIIGDPVIDAYVIEFNTLQAALAITEAIESLVTKQELFAAFYDAVALSDLTKLNALKTKVDGLS